MGKSVALVVAAAMASMMDYLKIPSMSQLAKNLRDRWNRPSRPKWTGEMVIKGACYNKSILRINARAKEKRRDPVRPTSTNVTVGRTSYRVFSDGSYRQGVRIGKRRLIPV
jgi:hypothetical protein